MWGYNPWGSPKKNNKGPLISEKQYGQKKEHWSEQRIKRLMYYAESNS